MENEQSAIALLLFRVGPVLCCAPADPVQSIIAPPKLTHPPGSSDAKPGIFYHANHLISVSDLRHRFGVAVDERDQAGRLIITQQGEAFIAYWVDEIIEVIATPAQGWAEPPTHLPKGVFSRTLLLNEKIYLYADLANFENLPESDYLSQYIDRLAGKAAPEEETAEPQTGDLEVATSPPDGNVAINTDPAVAEMPAAASVETTTEIPDQAMPDASVATTTEPDGQDDTTHSISAVPPPAIPVTDESSEIETDATLTEPAALQSPPETTSAPEAESSATLPTEDSEPQAMVEDETGPIDENSFAAFDHDQASPQDEANAGAPEVTQDTAELAPIVKLSAVEKAARLKNGYLKPVPSVVPASEQEPPPPPFPWRNLAAALLLIVTLAGIGIYTLLSSSGQPDIRVAQKTITNSIAPVSQVPQKIAAEARDDKPEKTAVVAQAKPDDAKNQAKTVADTDYRAEIKPDRDGVTIVLHTPDKKPALRTSKPASEQDRPEKASHDVKNPGKEEIIHIVVKGDTLWAIAEHYVNDPYKYPQLARLSKINNPDRIYPGNRVRILRLNSASE